MLLRFREFVGPRLKTEEFGLLPAPLDESISNWRAAVLLGVDDAAHRETPDRMKASVWEEIVALDLMLAGRPVIAYSGFELASRFESSVTKRSDNSGAPQSRCRLPPSGYGFSRASGISVSA